MKNAHSAIARAIAFLLSFTCFFPVVLPPQLKNQT